MHDKTTPTPVFFYCEGASERRYVQDILMEKQYSKHIDSTTFVLQPLSPHYGKNSPVQLLDYAIESCKNLLAECWCIFDGDGDHHDWKAFWTKYDALEEDVKKRVTFVFQNSCWELWLALHVQKINTPLTESALIKILQESGKFPNYKKGNVRFKVLSEDKQAFNLAFRHSQALQGESSAIEHIKQLTNPVTTMNELITWFREHFPNFNAETNAQ
jgi:hypothetical protein